MIVSIDQSIFSKLKIDRKLNHPSVTRFKIMTLTKIRPPSTKGRNSERETDYQLAFYGKFVAAGWDDGMR